MSELSFDFFFTGRPICIIIQGWEVEEGGGQVDKIPGRSDGVVGGNEEWGQMSSDDDGSFE